MVQAAMAAEAEGKSKERFTTVSPHSYHTRIRLVPGRKKIWEIQKEIILAAFFHDIGHLLAFEEQETKSMGGFGVMHHEGLGEKLLIECGVPGLLSKDSQRIIP